MRKDPSQYWSFYEGLIHLKEKEPEVDQLYTVVFPPLYSHSHFPCLKEVIHFFEQMRLELWADITYKRNKRESAIYSVIKLKICQEGCFYWNDQQNDFSSSFAGRNR